MKNYTGDKTQVSYGEEWNEFIDLDVDYGGGAVIANRTITTMAGMTVGKYNGQVAFVMYRGGGADGDMYHIVENSATVITFEEDVQTAGLANTDDLSITLRGVLPSTTTEYFGDVQESDLPDPETEEKSYYAHGDSNHPERKDASITKMTFPASIPLNLINGKLLLYGLGYVKDISSNFGAILTTNNRGVMLGETILETALATPTGYLANDFVSIGDNAGGALNEGPEIREITAVTPAGGKDILTLDKPVRRYHPSGSAIKECDITTAKPVTHLIKPWATWPTFCLEAVLKGPDKNQTANDFVKHYPGGAIKSLSLKSSDENLTLDMEVNCLNALKNQRTRATVVNTDWLARKYLYSDSTVTINGVVYAQINSMDYGTDRNLKPKHYHTQDCDIRPFEHLQEGFEHKCTMEITAHNTTFWDLVKNKTKFNNSIKYERDATDDYVTFYFNNAYGKKAKDRLTDRTEIIVPLELTTGNFYAEFVDTIEYY